MAFGTPWDTESIRRIAVTAQCDCRTVARVGRGEPVRPSIRRRIMYALDTLGLKAPAAASEAHQ